MSTISLISCSKTKRPQACRAALLYDSALFRKSLLYAINNSDAYYILSAKYGLLSPEDSVERYELTLKSLSREQKLIWGDEVVASLKGHLNNRDEIVILCGRDYYQPIISRLKAGGHRLRFPLDDLSFGKRLRKLVELNDESALNLAHRDFYRILRELYIGQDGGRLLKDSNGKLLWPKKGLYFFFEPQECLLTHSYSPLLQRVTRVGTHAVSKGSKTTLWDRLSTHRGGNAGAGSHRSSIFRLHLGAALARRDPSLHVDTWSIGSVGTAEARGAELETEREVSRYMGETRILWLDIPDEAGPYSDRAFLERNAIGLLSRYNVLQGTANPEWLGTYSANVSIALSGLWNLNHLFLRPHPSFISVLSQYVSSTLGKSPSPSQSIAPSNWYHQQHTIDSPQLMLALDAPD